MKMIFYRPTCPQISVLTMPTFAWPNAGSKYLCNLRRLADKRAGDLHCNNVRICVLNTINHGNFLLKKFNYSIRGPSETITTLGLNKA